MERFYRLPQNISSFGGDIDGLFMIVAWLTAIVFFAVMITLLVFIVKYRHREGRPAHYVHGNRNLEYAWTAVTAVIVFVLAFMSRPLWFDIKDPDRFPEASLEVGVLARQFEWLITYPGADGQLGTGDDYELLNQFHVPANAPVRFALQAEDVIHSFYVPELRLKQDAVPGMHIPVWLEATQPGEYTLGCAELCGLGHYRMKATFTVHEPADFETWNAQQIAAAAGGTGPAVAARPAATGTLAASDAAHSH